MVSKNTANQQKQEEAVVQETAVETTETVETTEPTETAKPNIFSVFASANQSTATSRGNQLAYTARLTSLATDVVKIVNNRLHNPVSDEEAAMFQDMIIAAMKDHDATDDLVMQLSNNLEGVDYAWLSGLKKDDAENMIRSQQSKRSRAKSATMTQENFITMLTGAAAEIMLRIATNNPKKSGGVASGGKAKSLEEAQKMSEDDLKKAIRNVQSKKSIMKNKAGFSEASAEWQALLAEEQMLKDVRDNKQPVVTEEAQKAIELTTALQAQIAELDLSNMPPEEAAKALASIQQMLASK